MVEVLSGNQEIRNRKTDRVLELGKFPQDFSDIGSDF